MGTMQGWVTRNRMREEQERAKIEQARKEGFDDGYLAGKTFSGMEIASLRAKLASMREPLWMLREEHDAEIASLRAKLEAVPVEEIRAVCEWELGLDFPDTFAISSWLATVTK